MTKSNRARAVFPFLLAAGAACSAPPASEPAEVGATSTIAPQAFKVVSPTDFYQVCPEIPGQARCFAYAMKPERFQPQTGGGSVPIVGALAPSDLAAAYNYASVTAVSPAPTIGIIDWYDDPNALSDLIAYRTYYSLVPNTPSFQKVDQNGNAITPATIAAGSPPESALTMGVDTNVEIALDLDMVSAACPTCGIILVEANSAYIGDLGESVNTAVRMGATIISNSYGAHESSSNAASDAAYYEHAGVTIFASAGDSFWNAGTQYPAAGAWVIGVGGTALVTSGATRGYTETVWNNYSLVGGGGTGSGCSSFTTMPPWQGTAYGEPSPGCTKKMVADLSAVAAQTTAVSIYDTLSSGGWTAVGGTSAAAPLVGAMFGRAGLAGVSPGWVWDNQGDFYDVPVSSGNNVNPGTSSCPSPVFYCTSENGYDGPTGWGTPNVAKFASIGSQIIRQDYYWMALMKTQEQFDLTATY